MQDPYKVLGVPRDADMDVIKKAYRTLSRKYHPDANINNPNRDQAEEMFKQVQEAYEQIIRERESGTSYGSSGGGAYDSGSGSYGGSSYGYGSYGGGYGYQANYDPELQAAVNYINNQHFSEAMHVLDGISNRTAAWYYLHAIANAGLGNNVNARDDAAQAVNMEPGNLQYQRLYQQLSGSSAWYQDMGRGYGYEDCGTGSSMSRGCCTVCAVMTLCNCCCPNSAFLCC